MKQCLRPLGWLLALGLLWSQGSLVLAACEKTVRLPDTVPYAVKDEGGSLQGGLHVDLIREALRRMQCVARFVDMPWARSLMELQSGQIDMLPGAAETPERHTYAYFSRPMNNARNVLFVHVSDTKKQRPRQLSNIIGTDFKLAVRRGAMYGGQYDNLINQPQFVKQLSFVPSARSGFLMLAAGRVDGMVADELTGLRTVDQLGLKQQVARTDLVIDTAPLLVAFSMSTIAVAFVNRFNAALGRMAADGSYLRILERYMSCTVSMETLGCR